MEARVDGEGKATIIPSGEVRRRLVGLLASRGISDEGREAIDSLLQGGQEFSAGDSPGEETIRQARNGLRNCSLRHNERDFFDDLVSSADEGKYVPFISLPSPLEPGGFVSLQFERMKSSGRKTSSIILGPLLGHFESRQRFSIGRLHSTHLRIHAPAGTDIKACSPPDHWPDGTGKATESGASWRIYLPFRDKPPIWDAAENLDPDDPEWKAVCSFQTPSALHFVFLFLFSLLALAPRLLVGVCGGEPCIRTGELLNLFVLAGGVLVPVFLAEFRNPLPFRYVGWNAAFLAVLALAWFGLAVINPTAWYATIAGLALAGKEVLVLLSRGWGRATEFMR